MYSEENDESNPESGEMEVTKSEKKKEESL